ncbi:hypothetical protein [Enhydrobacter sp.]|nr:hypothetical protein [Enhydrobacter sp.]WIM12719.1 MAG: hypothetical protein OJF58_003682 [Enhydrobacter sp.]
MQNAYLGASPLSRRRRLDTLRGLDDRLLRDIGVAARRRTPAADGSIRS